MMRNWAPLVRQLRATNAMLAAKLRLGAGVLNPASGTFAAYFQKRESAKAIDAVDPHVANNDEPSTRESAKRGSNPA